MILKRCVAMLLISLWALLFPAFARQTPTDRLLTVISSTPGEALGPELAVTSRGHVFATWTNHQEPAEEVFFRRSMNGGETFGLTYKLSRTPGGFSLLSSVAATARGGVYVAWGSRPPEESPTIRLRSSWSGGLTFSAPRVVRSLASFPPEPKVVAGPRDFVGILWIEFTGSAFELYFARSSDAGRTFAAPVLLERRYQILHHRVILDEQGTIHAVWTARDQGSGRTNVIFASRSTDGGETFSSPARLSSAILPAQGLPAYPQVAAFGHDVYIAWTDLRRGQIEIRRSPDNGLTFDPAVVVVPVSGRTPFGLGVGESGNVYVAYEAGGFVIVRSQDGGETFDEMRRMSEIGRVTDDGLRMAVGPGEQIYLLWISGAGQEVHILFARVDGR